MKPNAYGKSGLKGLKTDEFKNRLHSDGVAIDLRSPSDFTMGFIPGSIFLGTNQKYLSLIAKLFLRKQPLLFVADPENYDEIFNAILHADLKNCIGFLEGGFEAWKNAGEPVDMIIDIEADELIMDIPFEKRLMILDVRDEIEFAEGHLENANNIPLHELTDPLTIAQIDEAANLYIYSSAGYRSTITASILKRHGLNQVRNVIGGWSKIRELEKAKIVKEGKLLN